MIFQMVRVDHSGIRGGGRWLELLQTLFLLLLVPLHLYVCICVCVGVCVLLFVHSWGPESSMSFDYRVCVSGAT